MRVMSRIPKVLFFSVFAIGTVFPQSNLEENIKQLKNENDISILVSDNGKGFNFESKYKSMSLVLKTLSERAKILSSQLILKSEPDIGTTLTMNIPITV